MADVVCIRDKPVTIFDFRDFLEEVDNCMGYDAKTWLENYFNDQEVDLKDERDALEYEMKSYEASNEEYHRTMNDADELLREIIKDWNNQGEHPRKMDILRPWYKIILEIHKLLNSKL